MIYPFSMDILKNKNVVILDTESTGFSKSGHHDQPNQARMCQLAMILADGDGNVRGQFSSLVKPDGWVISDGAFNCHGISMDDCEKHGLPISIVMNMYLWFMHRADIVVAHNTPFDKRIMEIEELFQNTGGAIEANRKPWYCTQDKSKGICKIPPTPKMIKSGRTGYKTPSLAEAYMHFTGKEIENAHDAMQDAMACMAIYFALNK